ncbi:MAG: M56 family metallopeptidase [Myxococcota bacterium]
MSAVAGPEWVDVIVGLGLDVAWKSSIPLAAGLLLSALPGSAASKHSRLVIGCVAVPIVAVATVVLRGGDAAVMGVGGGLAVLWGLGAVVGLGALAYALWGLARLPSSASKDGIEYSPALTAPVTAGWLRPRIIAPLDFEEWPLDARSAALDHERAHIARGDWLVHVATWALHALLWFHPLMWWVRHRLSVLAECAADDAVVRAGHDPATYAQQLLRLSQSGPAIALGLGASPIRTRVRALLARRSRRGATFGSTLLVAVGVTGLAYGVSAISAWQPPPTSDVPHCQPEPFLHGEPQSVWDGV